MAASTVTTSAAASSASFGAKSGAGGGSIGFTSKNLREFLSAHKIKTETPALITHTRIPGEGVPGGSYHIPNDRMPEFYEHYFNQVFIRREPEWLTEKQLSGQPGEPCGPVLVDFDFRYPPTIKERQHTAPLIEDLMSLYAEKVSMIMDIPENTSVTFYVFEKPEANTKDPSITKDGIHFVISIPMPRDGQRLLRELVKEELKDVLGELPLTNDVDSILDVGITNGYTNWQLFGSRKPGHHAYDITNIVEFKAAADGTLAPDNVISVDSVNRRQLLRLTSARTDLRNGDGTVIELSQFAKEKIGRMDTTGARKKNTTFRLISGAQPVVSTIEELERCVDDFLKSLRHEDYLLREVHDYTMALPNHFSDDYHTWIQTGLALHNTDHRLFYTWMLFSSRSDKFDFADIPRYRNMWDAEFKEAVGGLTYRSIIYWLRRENRGEYDRIHSNTVDYFVSRTLNSRVQPREFDFAMVLYEMFKNEYRCASVKYNKWYVFESHRWKEVDSGNTIRFSISNDLRGTYLQKLDKLLTKPPEDSSTELAQYSGGGGAAAAAGGSPAAVAASSGGEDGRNPMTVKCLEYCSKMNDTSWKNNMMKEVREIFYRKDPDFYKMANTKRHLLCFNNGVVDFEKKEFRDGLPEDYITMTTGINYVRFNPANPSHVRIRAEIEEFLRQLFPVDELYEYMMNHLASALIGYTKAQTFTIYNGVGRNGKSALMELMGLVLGEYKGTVPITAVTQKRTNIGSASPEIAKLCGVRFAVMQEPTKGDRLNDGIMKELTGTDPIQARQLYNEPIEFIPQFKLVMCTNTLLDINTDDDGTWRRIKLVEFMSKFVDDPKSTNKYEFKIDRSINLKFDTWKELFASMLVERAFMTNGDVPDCPMVLAASNQYRQKQNVFAEFVTDCVGTREPDAADDEYPPLTLNDAWVRFKVWFQDGHGKTPPKRKELEQYLEKTLGAMTSGGARKGWNTYYMKSFGDGFD